MGCKKHTGAQYTPCSSATPSPLDQPLKFSYAQYSGRKTSKPSPLGTTLQSLFGVILIPEVISTKLKRDSDMGKTAKHNQVSHKPKWELIGLILLAALVILPAIQRDLPYANDFDEPTYVKAAVRMAATGNLNPGWFGHPGSTVIYPLTALYHTWYTVTQQGDITQPNPDIQTHFDSGHAWEYYLLGRLLAVTYALLTIPLVYKFGVHVFGRRIALAGSLLNIFSPYMVFYARMVRTDSAATFFGLLCLWRCILVFKQPSQRNHLLVGLTLGLAIATRYFMATLLVVYVGVNALHFFNRSGQPQRQMNLRTLTSGLIMMGLTFAFSSPYFFLDFGTVLHDFQIESRTANLGFDGLSPAGNFLWYLTTGIPRTATWPPAVCALIGIGFILWRRKPLQLLLTGFITVFLVTISLPALHWPRWTLQILPLLALIAVYGVDQLISFIMQKGRYAQRIQRFLFMTSMLVILILPVYRVIVLNIKWSHFTTRITMANWVKEHIPPGSLVAMETFQMVVDAPGSQIHEIGFLAEMELSPKELAAQGYDYAITNQERYGRYYAEPDRYPEAIAFYEALFKEALLIQEVKNSTTRAGPTIQIYQLVTQPDEQ